MKHSILLAALFCIFTTLPSKAETYQFVTLDFPPLEFRGEGGRADGAIVEVVREIMTDLGHEVNIEVLPWARALRSVRTGEAHAIFTAYKTSEREAFLDYSNEVLIPQVIALYVKKGSGITYGGDLASLKDKTFGVVSTISYGPTFDGLRDQLRTVRVNTQEAVFQKLLLGGVDVVPSNLYVAGTEIRQMGIADKVTRLPDPLDKLPSYIAFSKKQKLKALRDRFDEALIRMKESSRYLELMRKHGIEHISGEILAPEGD